MVGGGQADKGVEVEPPLPYPFGKEQRQPQLDPRDAIGDLLEGRLVAVWQLAGGIEAVGGVIGGEDLEGSVPEPGPHRLLRRPVTRRRAAAEFGAFDARLGEVFGG